VIDLHLHTTASDGRSAPADLIREASLVGIRILAVTDHDTVAAHEEARAAGRALGVAVIGGIEVTAVDAGRDVHVLGLFLERPDRPFLTFLETQRGNRRRRVAEIVARLAGVGVHLSLSDVLETGTPGTGRAIGRPAVAQALVAGGHVASVAEAFDRYLADGRPGFVPRQGVDPPTVVGHLTRVGAVAAMAHPGKTGRDDLIGPMVDAGMAAIEVFHPDHSPEDVARYAQLAADRGLLRTGGSDYHGSGSGRTAGFGRVGLPEADYQALGAHVARHAVPRPIGEA